RRIARPRGPWRLLRPANGTTRRSPRIYPRPRSAATERRRSQEPPMSTRVPHWVNGAPRHGEGRSAPVTNPATGQVTGQVPLASTAEVSAVVGSARAAFPAWRDASLAKRTEVLFAFRE